jgi:hypothetical protein
MLFKKRSLLPFLLLGFALLLMILFIFNAHWDFHYRTILPPYVFVLVDKSLSVGNVPDLKNSPILRINYFADTVSEKTNGLNPEFTALFDSIRTIKNKAGMDSKIIVLSDFNDNASLSPSEKFPFVYPVIVQNETNERNRISLYKVEMPEWIQAKEGVKIKIFTYVSGSVSASVNSIKAKLTLKNEKNVLSEKIVTLKTGLNELSWEQTFSFAGCQLIQFQVENLSDPAAKPSSLSRLVQSVPEFYRIYFLAGKPSEEYAFVKRFLGKIKWVKIESALLKQKGETIAIPNLQNDSGVILMDLEDRQIRNFEALQEARKRKIPIFYQVGLNEISQTRLLLGLFTNGNFMENFSERKFLYNNNELIVKSILDSEGLIWDFQDKGRVFWGWDTWKWDFMKIPEELAYQNFENFWQNNLHFILEESGMGMELEKLNYVLGEENPLHQNKKGIYSFLTNQKEEKIFISDNPEELALKTPNLEIARNYQTNLIFLDQIKDFEGYAKTIMGNQKVFVEKILTIDFRSNIIIFLLIAACLIFFWILSDYEKIKG